MKLSRALIAASLLVASAVYAATRPAPAQDVTKVAGDSHHVLFENDRVRVISVDMKPGQVAPMHSHPDSVAYFLQGGTIKVTTPDGKSFNREPKTGSVSWSDPVTHQAENIGSTEVKELQIELKPAAH